LYRRTHLIILKNINFGSPYNISTIVFKLYLYVIDCLKQYLYIYIRVRRFAPRSGPFVCRRVVRSEKKCFFYDYYYYYYDYVCLRLIPKTNLRPGHPCNAPRTFGAETGRTRCERDKTNAFGKQPRACETPPRVRGRLLQQRVPPTCAPFIYINILRRTHVHNG